MGFNREIHSFFMISMNYIANCIANQSRSLETNFSNQECDKFIIYLDS